MAVIEQAKRAVERRQYYGNSNNCSYSNGYVGAFLIFLLFSCITARRRRRLGNQPFYGTGWAAGGHGQPQYTNQQPYYGNQQYPSQPSAQYNQGWNQPPPQYGAQGTTGEHYGGYPKPDIPGQENGVELQQPNQAYQPQRGGESVYNPPAGPPPGK
ncbi:MAG: hypothetical protein MMC23_006099 [Stictis urceolatum]|nr:hypothetical protein [Stictis urceolata]